MGHDTVAFGIMCKAPRAGASKTRLCPPLTAEEAAALSSCFITDVAALIGSLPPLPPSSGVAVYTPAGAEADFADLLPPAFALLAQRGEGLGQRLLRAVHDLLAAGHRGVCLMNSDSPTLPLACLEAAATALAKPGDRLVLGPSIDGGYYLIGLKSPHAAFFQGIAWSTGSVLTQTLSAAATLRLPVTLLPAWYDVDNPAALRLLLHELFGDGCPLAVNAAKGSSARHSRGYLHRLLQQEGSAKRLAFAEPTAQEAKPVRSGFG